MIDNIRKRINKEFIQRLFIYGAILAFSIPFLFKNTTPEADVYYMGVGLLRFTMSGVLTGYGSDFSFLYYYFHRFLAELINLSPSAIMLFYNICNFVFTFIFFMVFEVTIRAIAKREESKYFILMLVLMPIVWFVGLYAHPITPSNFFFFVALFLFVKYLATTTRWIEIRYIYLLLAICAYVISMSFRVDAAFLAMVFPAAVFALNKQNIKNCLVSGFFVFICFVAYMIIRANVIGVSGYKSDSSALLFYSDLSHWRLSLNNIIRSTGLGGLVLFFVSSCILIAKRKWGYLILPLTGILSILFIWFPNPIPVRRFYHLSPLIIMLAYFAYVSLSNKNKRRGVIISFFVILLLGNWILPPSLKFMNDKLGLYRFKIYENTLMPFSYDIYCIHQAGKKREAKLMNVAKSLDKKYDKPIIILGPYGFTGAIRYYLFSKEMVQEEITPAVKGFFSYRLNLYNGNQIILSERGFDKGDSLKFFMEQEEYNNSNLILLELNGEEDIDNLDEHFNLLYGENII